jgi:hypothetical protein
MRGTRASQGRRPTRPYTSFLLRYWQRGASERRITVEHIQSGATTCVRSLGAALDWIGALAGEPSVEPMVHDGSRQPGLNQSDGT